MRVFERYMPTVGRVMLALVFMISGIGKLVTPDPTLEYIGAVGFPAPHFVLSGAFVVETVGALFLITGYHTRAVAIALAVFALATAAAFHSDLADQSQAIHFLKNIAISGGLLTVAAFGAGDFSLDVKFYRSHGA